MATRRRPERSAPELAELRRQLDQVEVRVYSLARRVHMNETDLLLYGIALLVLTAGVVYLTRETVVAA